MYCCCGDVAFTLLLHCCCHAKCCTLPVRAAAFAAAATLQVALLQPMMHTLLLPLHYYTRGCIQSCIYCRTLLPYTKLHTARRSCCMHCCRCCIAAYCYMYRSTHCCIHCCLHCCITLCCLSCIELSNAAALHPAWSPKSCQLKWLIVLKFQSRTLNKVCHMPQRSNLQQQFVFSQFGQTFCSLWLVGCSN